MKRYRVFVDGVLVGACVTKGAAIDLVMRQGETAPMGSVLNYEIRFGEDLIASGELAVEPSAAAR